MLEGLRTQLSNSKLLIDMKMPLTIQKSRNFEKTLFLVVRSSQLLEKTVFTWQRSIKLLKAWFNQVKLIWKSRCWFRKGNQVSTQLLCLLLNQSIVLNWTLSQLLLSIWKGWKNKFLIRRAHKLLSSKFLHLEFSKTEHIPKELTYLGNVIE